MATTFEAPAAPEAARVPAIQRRGGELRWFLRRAALFCGIGLVLYLGLYAATEWLIGRHAERNRFFMVATAPLPRYDAVILGASHAAVFDYRDMNERLEEMTGASVLNLSTVGGGVLLNRLLLDYFYAEREAGTVLYVLDSFAFYSPEWNEERLRDASLFARAPWDPTLAALLLSEPAARGTALDYLSGFSKINNRERFAPDRLAAEGAAFERSYRPIAQLDRQRLAYLYPEGIDARSLEESPYLAEFEALIQEAQARGSRFVVVRPPIPERVRAMIPHEDDFDRTIQAVLERHGVELYDFSRVGNDPELFYDSDHLNQDGVLRFFQDHLGPLLSGFQHSDGEVES